MGFRTLDNADVTGKRVLLRVDLNVPMSADGQITDATRIERVAPTITELADRGARVVMLAHFGRPKGQRVADMTLKPVAAGAEKVLGRPVAFAEDCVGPVAKAAVDALQDGDILLLENTRYHAGEEKNDPEFVAELAANGDLFVADAFSCAHRAHASTAGLADRMPAIAGRCMQAEVEALTDALEAPKRPAAALVGGAKVSTKLDVLGNLFGKVDVIIVGGGMANTFLLAQGVAIGKSLAEPDLLDTARDIMARAEKAGCELLLPVDAVCAASLANDVPTVTVPIDQVPADQMILDVGPASIEKVTARLAECQTIMWNGPMGAFEFTPFDVATNAVAQAVAKASKAGSMLSVAGGGDTVAALNHAGAADDFSYVSTAGGAFLEWLEGKELPGVAVLSAD